MGSALGFLVPWVVLGTSSLIASSRSNRDAQRVTALISGPSSSVCVSMFASVRVSKLASDASLPAIFHLRSSVCVSVLSSLSLFTHSSILKSSLRPLPSPLPSNLSPSSSLSPSPCLPAILPPSVELSGAGVD